MMTYASFARAPAYNSVCTLVYPLYRMHTSIPFVPYAYFLISSADAEADLCATRVQRPDPALNAGRCTARDKRLTISTSPELNAIGNVAPGRFHRLSHQA